MLTNPLTLDHILSITELTFLNDNMTLVDQEKSVEDLLARAINNSCLGVCVREQWVQKSRKILDESNSNLLLVSVIGFPNGSDYSIEQKLELLEKASSDGADEFDMVISLDWVKSGQWDRLQKEWHQMHVATGSKALKLIFENSLLSKEEKKLTYKLAREVFLEQMKGNRFFKTNTGYHGSALLDDIQMMKEYTQDIIGIKAAAGIKTLDQARAFCASVNMIRSTDLNTKLFRIGSSSLI